MYFSLDVLVASTFTLEVRVPNALPPNTEAAVLRRNTRAYPVERERFYGTLAVRYDAGEPIFVASDLRHLSTDEFMPASTQATASTEHLHENDSNHEVKN